VVPENVHIQPCVGGIYDKKVEFPQLHVGDWEGVRSKYPPHRRGMVNSCNSTFYITLQHITGSFMGKVTSYYSTCISLRKACGKQELVN